jgi:hypothetical protein
MNPGQVIQPLDVADAGSRAIPGRRSFFAHSTSLSADSCPVWLPNSERPERNPDQPTMQPEDEGSIERKTADYGHEVVRP